MRFLWFVFLPVLILAACASPREDAPIVIRAPGSATPPSPAEPPAGTPRELSARFADLPGWDLAGIEAPLSAFKRSCLKIDPRPDTDLLDGDAPWAGYVHEWRPACEAVDAATDDASARHILERIFSPVEITAPDGSSKFTGYFEPTYQARYTPTPPYTEPVPAMPDDLVITGGKPMQKLPGGALRPYPERSVITSSGVRAMAYAHPADVFFLQIQGSGRLVFPDGTTIRAAYGANNGHPFGSTANWLMETRRIERGEATMQGIRAWMDRAGPQETRLAMNQNPRFVFFRPLPEGDPALGPEGAQGVPLTPLGSMAVDTSIHPLGAPMYVTTHSPGLGGDWAGMLVAQDTGGAIKGPVRGDIYFGTGAQAGERAGVTNAPGRLWVFLPKAVAARMRAPVVTGTAYQPVSP